MKKKVLSMVLATSMVAAALVRRIFLRGCMSKNVGVVGYGEAF